MTASNFSPEDGGKPGDERLENALGRVFQEGGDPAPAQLAAIRRRVLAGMAEVSNPKTNKERKMDMALRRSEPGKIFSLLKRMNHGVLDVAAIVIIAVLLGLAARNYLQPSPASPANQKNGGRQLGAAVPPSQKDKHVNEEAPPPNETPKLSTAENDGRPQGSFGNRNGAGRRVAVKRYGGGKDSEKAVDQALRWLAFHQEGDGHWDARKWNASQKTDTSVTALSLLAYLGAGHTEKVGQFKDNVKAAVKWLRSKQDSNGLVLDRDDAAQDYAGAMTTLALAEAAGMGNVPETRNAAQKAVSYWAEGRSQDMARTLSVVGWHINALKSAKIAGLKSKPKVFEEVIYFLDSVEKKDPAGSQYANKPGTAADCNSTAIGNFGRLFLEWKKEDLQKSMERLLKEGGAPYMGGNGPVPDVLYWYFGSLAAFQQGGEVWKQWNSGLQSALVPNQNKTGDDAGSWHSAGQAGGLWGRAGQTALCALCLETYYRYMRIQPDPDEQAVVEDVPEEKSEADPAALEKAIREAMKVKTSFAFGNLTLEEAVSFFGKVTPYKVKLAPDAQALAKSAVTLRVTDMQMDLALQWVCKLVGLDYKIEDGAIVLFKPAAQPAPKNKVEKEF